MTPFSLWIFFFRSSRIRRAELVVVTRTVGARRCRRRTCVTTLGVSTTSRSRSNEGSLARNVPSTARTTHCVVRTNLHEESSRAGTGEQHRILLNLSQKAFWSAVFLSGDLHCFQIVVTGFFNETAIVG